MKSNGVLQASVITCKELVRKSSLQEKDVRKWNPSCNTWSPSKTCFFIFMKICQPELLIKKWLIPCRQGLMYLQSVLLVFLQLWYRTQKFIFLGGNLFSDNTCFLPCLQIRCIIANCIVKSSVTSWNLPKRD